MRISDWSSDVCSSDLSDGDGYYDVQMADRDDAALRARFRTDKEGRFSFWSVVPSHYPIPDDGPVGEMLAATKRHPYRPAHVHFMIAKDGFEGLTTHIFRSEERRVGKEGVRTFQSRGWTDH